MGSAITIDKHLTNIVQWLQVTRKLQDINFQGQVNSHIGLWRIAQDGKGELQISPVHIQIETLSKIFLKNQCYILYGIKNSNHLNPQGQQLFFPRLLKYLFQNLRTNIIKISYKTPLTINSICGHQYRLYALFGKNSNSKQRLLATSYALRLNELFDSEKKLCIVSGGGVLRNKKLQKGSVLTLQNIFKNQSVAINDSNIQKMSSKDFQQIDIFKFYNPKPIQLRQSEKLNREPLSIFSFKSKLILPVIKTEINQQFKFQRKFRAEDSSNFQSSNSINPPLSSVLDQNSIAQMIPDQKPQKKNGLQKINFKLDFSKPLKLGGLNLVLAKNQQNPVVSSNKNFQNYVSLTNRSDQCRGKRQKCEQECSQVIEGLYVSGQKVAKNYQTLHRHQIKYIINCAGDYCENWFQDKGIQYLTFFLKDSQNQNIQCLFYRVIDFIQNAHKNKENVLVHCIQGISRSVTFVIAYIIFKYGYDYKKAQSFIKQKRSIACPNNGFMVELIQFHKRLYDQYDSLSKPRVFLVSSHSKETPHILTARMLKNTLFDSKRYIGLDSRGVYIIHLPEIVYIWVGSKCDQKKLEAYWTYANEFVKKIQKYQRAPLKIKALSQGSQQKEFLSIWSLNQPPKLYSNSQYDRLFFQGQGAKPGLQRRFYEQIEEEQVQNKKLYIYPDYKTGLGVFFLQDLVGLCILSIIHVQKNQKYLSLHIWKDHQFVAESDVSEQDFLSYVIKNNYFQFEEDNIQIFQEDFQKPSEIFKDAFIS